MATMESLDETVSDLMKLSVKICEKELQCYEDTIDALEDSRREMISQRAAYNNARKFSRQLKEMVELSQDLHSVSFVWYF